MKVPKKILLATIVTGSAGLMAMSSSEASGYCWGTAAKGEGGCEGKTPSSVEYKKWPCATNAPRAEWGWQNMSKEKCESASFANNKVKSAFSAAGFKTPQHTEKARNPLYKKEGYTKWLKKDLKDS